MDNHALAAASAPVLEFLKTYVGLSKDIAHCSMSIVSFSLILFAVTFVLPTKCRAFCLSLPWTFGPALSVAYCFKSGHWAATVDDVCKTSKGLALIVVSLWGLRAMYQRRSRFYYCRAGDNAYAFKIVLAHSLALCWMAKELGNVFSSADQIIRGNVVVGFAIALFGVGTVWCANKGPDHGIWNKCKNPDVFGEMCVVLGLVLFTADPIVNVSDFACRVASGFTMLHLTVVIFDSATSDDEDGAHGGARSNAANRYCPCDCATWNDLVSRPRDLAYATFFAFMLYIGLTMDIINPLVEGAVTAEGTKDNVWPPQFMYDVFQFWAKYDPALAENDFWMRVMAGFSSTIFVPFYACALYSVVYKEERFDVPLFGFEFNLRAHGLAWCGAMIMSVSACFCTAFQHAGTNRTIFAAAYGPYLIFPFFAFARFASDDELFSEEDEKDEGFMGLPSPGKIIQTVVKSPEAIKNLISSPEETPRTPLTRGRAKASKSSASKRKASASPAATPTRRSRRNRG